MRSTQQLLFQLTITGLLILNSLISTQAQVKSGSKSISLDTIVPVHLDYPKESVHDLFMVYVDYNQDGYFTYFRRRFLGQGGNKDSLLVYYQNEQTLNTQKIYIPWTPNSYYNFDGAKVLGVPYKDHYYLFNGQAVYDYKVNLNTGQAQLVKARRINMMFDHFKTTHDGYLMLYNNYPVTDIDSGNLSIYVLNPHLDSVQYQDLSPEMKIVPLYYSVDKLFDYDSRTNRIVVALAQHNKLFVKESGKPLREWVDLQAPGSIWKTLDQAVIDSFTQLHPEYTDEVDRGVTLSEGYDYIKYMKLLPDNRLLVVRNLYMQSEEVGAYWALDEYRIENTKVVKRISNRFLSHFTYLPEDTTINEQTIASAFGSTMNQLACMGKTRLLVLGLQPPSYNMSFFRKNYTKEEFFKQYEEIALVEDNAYSLFIYTISQ